MARPLSVDFACAGCGKPVGLTVHCQGGPASPAVVLVSCPCCGRANHVMFDPDGVVRSVKRFTSIEDLPPPSDN
jgi:hypothetical protein